MPSDRYNCMFPDCPRIFDRWTRLEKHFRDHIGGTIKHRTHNRNSSSAQGRRISKTPQRRQNKKHRSSNLRSHQPIHLNNGASRTTMIDLRTPSLSPDTPSEMEDDEMVIPSTPVTPLGEVRKGPRWVVAPRSPSLSPSPSHYANDNIIIVQPLQLSRESVQEISQLNNQDKTTSQNRTDNPFLINHQDSSSFSLNKENSDESDIEIEQAENVTIPHISTHNSTTPQKQNHNDCILISPFAKLSSCMPKSDPPYVPIPNIDDVDQSTSDQNSTPSSSSDQADEISDTPNSLDRFMKDAMASIGMRRERSETPCPPPRGIIDNRIIEDLMDDSNEDDPTSSTNTDNTTRSGISTRSDSPKTAEPSAEDETNSINTRDGSSTSPVSSNEKHPAIPLEVIQESSIRLVSVHPSTPQSSHTEGSQDSFVNLSLGNQDKNGIDIGSALRKIGNLFEELKEGEKRNRERIVEIDKLMVILFGFHGHEVSIQ